MSNEITALTELVKFVGVLGALALIAGVVGLLYARSKTKENNELVKAQAIINAQYPALQQRVQELEDQREKDQRRIDVLEREKQTFHDALIDARNEVQAVKRQMDTALNALREERERKIHALEATIETMKKEKTAELARHADEIAALKAQIKLLTEQRDAAMVARDAALAARDVALQQSAEKDALIKDRDGEIARLNKRIAELEDRVKHLESAPPAAVAAQAPNATPAEPAPIIIENTVAVITPPAEPTPAAPEDAPKEAKDE